MRLKRKRWSKWVLIDYGQYERRTREVVLQGQNFKHEEIQYRKKRRKKTNIKEKNHVI